MAYKEEEVAVCDWAVTVGSDDELGGGVVLTVDEEIGTVNRIAGVAVSPEQARALAALLLRRADRAEGKTK